MSRAQDKKKIPVLPEEQEHIQHFEAIYNQYRDRIRNYIAVKTNSATADDLTQQAFLKAMENFHLFKCNSSIFTWLFKIAQNIVKNEYRTRSRNKEMVHEVIDFQSQSISLDIARDVDIRLDISAALARLNELDQQIISLRFFVDCTLLEISKIIGMPESAVKNRLYRALNKLKKELKEWGDITIMSIKELISIVDKSEAPSKNDGMNKVYHDLFEELKSNVDRIITTYRHRPSQKIAIEIYPDLPTFHQAINEPDAPNWFMGTYEDNKIKIVSPLNPGPEHTYQSVLRHTISLFTMWLVKDINPLAPKWLTHGLGGHEAKQMSQEYIQYSTSEAIQNNAVPSFQALTDDTWDFEKIGGYGFSHLIVEYLIHSYSLDALNKFIRDATDFQGAFQVSEAELHGMWVQYLKSRLC
ncbi:RNA polymerase sigma factor [Paenibacillus eucommiae]|uniref:RNA polymerase sigma factor n=1 Tax=Paenibacillus eucommiae TaxID=1355755 RepID=A0ABS4J3G7_9BACL|nr:sigma-70 family RNA polymerase sigma factor [Paenibacillus eucommiae]MBP1994348.1 RNA polymerase sigma-70 factor (ECF subfamily) [Paenibacillus eucommiae]